MNEFDFKIINQNIKRIRKILHLNRIKILTILIKDETCTCELVDKIGISNNLISHHLKVLTQIGIIKSRKIGLHVKYSIQEKERQEINRILNCLNNIYQIKY